MIGTLAQVAISRYAEKGLSFVDDRVREVLADAADGSPEAVAEADVHLAVKFLEQPAQAAELLDLVLEPPFVREVAPGTQLKKYRSVVRGAFDVAHAMPGRRGAVPGWFTGTECAALLDARLGPNNGWSPELSGSWPDDAKPDELAQLDTQGEYLLSRNTSSGMSGKPPGVPRVLIIEAERDIPEEPMASIGDSNASTALTDNLNTILQERARGSSAAGGRGAGLDPDRAWTEVLGDAAVDPDAVRYVERIYEWRIRLGPPASAARRQGRGLSVLHRAQKAPGVWGCRSPNQGAGVPGRDQGDEGIAARAGTLACRGTSHHSRGLG